MYYIFRANGILYKYQYEKSYKMTGNTTNISIRMNTELKAQADALFEEIGMNISSAFNIFLLHALYSA